MTSTAGSRPGGAEEAPASPAERYARAAARARALAGPLGTFRQQYPFELDDFQLRACEALADGHGVLVAAPTGSGKTVVGEFAVHLALQTGRKAFYTTPIKALSNQKYADLVHRYGPDAVGLLTGDNTINGEAPVVVMTTEVLRNMLYADSPTLGGLGYVVMDEVHYLADRFRGAVWEEVIIHLPDDVQVVSLSATVSNAEEFGDWLDTVRGDTEVIVSEHRPVPLFQHVLAGRRMYDLFEEVVEELFVRGLVKAVFATETLALGINMPARSVVLEKLVKWNGEQHADITPGEYTQLTGRAGRRGIDIEGHAVVLWQPGVDPAQVAGLASTRTYPLRSSFRPGYNMAVNLVDRVGVAAGRALLERSFAQFQADRSVVGLARRIDRNVEALAGYAEAMTCHLGDFAEYARLRRQISERERALARSSGAARRAEGATSLAKLQRGDVIAVPGGRRSGLAVVLDTSEGSAEDPRPLVLTEDRWAGRLSIADFPSPVQALGRMRLPKRVEHRVPRVRRDLASALRETGITAPPRARRRSEAADDAELAALRRALRAHPRHGCDDREAHARWAERYDRLHRETETLRQQVAATTHSLARTFDRIRALLAERGYLDGEQLTEHGRRLARLWSESDLLTAECLRHGIWDGLQPAELAAVVSALVYEARGDDVTPRVPAGPVSDALVATVRLWGELEADERRHRLERTREPDLGFAWPAYRWARGESLSAVLAAAQGNAAELSAGDFVRWCRQLVDLLDQVRAVAGEDSGVGLAAASAVRALRRGVVALGTG